MGQPGWEAWIARQEELAAVPAALRQSAAHVAIPARFTVFRVGARPTKIFWVLDGEIRLVRRSRGGAEVVLQRASAGFVAEASLDAAAYHCDAVAVARSELLAFPIVTVRKLLADDERFRAFWLQRLVREVRTLRSQCERLALRAAADRIEHYIESEGTNGCLQLAVSRKAWAAELGLTHEALYRALAGLKRKGQLTAVEKGGVVTLTMKRGKSPRMPLP